MSMEVFKNAMVLEEKIFLREPRVRRFASPADSVLHKKNSYQVLLRW